MNIHIHMYILYISKTQKMVLDAALLNSQHYKVWIKDKVEQSRERSSASSLHLGVVANKKRVFGSPSTTLANFTLYMSNKEVWFGFMAYQLCGLFNTKSFLYIFIKSVEKLITTIQVEGMIY